MLKENKIQGAMHAMILSTIYFAKFQCSIEIAWV